MFVVYSGGMVRPLIVGEAPSRTGDVYYRFPLSGRVGERLCTWAGIAPLEKGTRYGRFYWPLREQFELRNLLERYPGAAGSGAALPMVPAREAWAELEVSLSAGPRRRVVLLGSRLALVADVSAPTFEWVQREGHDVVVVPHPSGLNRVYNDPLAQESVSRVLREALLPSG